MKKKRKVFYIALACLLLAACGGESKNPGTAEAETQQAGKQKIICYDVSVSKPYMEALVSAFNARSSRTEVEMRYLEEDSYDDEIIRILSEGENVDIAWIRQPSKANRMAEANLLYDLSDMINDSSLDISKYGQSLDIVQMDERIYSLPFIQNIWLLFYNKDIFDQLGLNYPDQMTWEEYADLAQQIKERQPEGSFKWGGYLPDWVPNLGALELGEYLYDDELPATKNFLQLMDRLYNIDHSHPNIREMEDIYDPGYSMFLDGDMAMMINGDWTIQIFHNLGKTRLESCRWDAAGLPLTSGAEEGTSVGSNSYLAVSSRSRYPQNAFEFLEFCCGEEGASVLASNYCFPSYYTESSREIYLQNAGITHDLFFFDAILQNEEGKHLLYRDLRDVFNEEAVNYLSGEKSLDTAMEDYLKGRNALQAEEKTKKEVEKTE